MTALRLFRTDLKILDPFFSKEKKELSQLYLIKEKKQLLTKIGFDICKSVELENHLRKLEYLILTNQRTSDSFPDPFESLCRNNLTFQLMACKYHNPGKFFTETTKFELENIELPKNRQKSEMGNLSELFLGVPHKCPVPTFPQTKLQIIEEKNDEFWRIKFNQNGDWLLGSTRNRFLICWEFQVTQFIQKWKTQLEQKEEINDFCISDKKNRVFIATQNGTLVIVDLVTGARYLTLLKAHSDLITSIYCLNGGEEYITGGADGFLIFWDSNNTKSRELKTKRVTLFSVAPCEAFLLLVHSNSLCIDHIDLNTLAIKANLIQEKHAIISQQISQNSELLLINTSFDLPELHLWRISDGVLLKTYNGHFQKHFVIGCSFFDDNLICCGSENGSLYFWHINDNKPVFQERRHDLSLNSVAITNHHKIGILILATCSDDGKILISKK